MSEHTDLITIEPSKLPAMLSDEKKMLAAIKVIKKTALSEVPDTSSKKGRDAIASLAYKVAQTKAPLKQAADARKVDAQKIVSDTNASVKIFNDEMDALKSTIRKPLDAWLTEDQKRKDTIVENMRAMETLQEAKSSAAIADQIAALTAKEITKDEWAEYKSEAQITKDHTLRRLERAKDAAIEQEKIDQEREEARAAEQEELRKAKARAAELEAQAEQDRIEREKREAEEKKERDEQAAKDRAEQDKLDRIAADEKAELEEKIKKQDAEIAAAKEAEADRQAAAEKSAKPAPKAKPKSASVKPVKTNSEVAQDLIDVLTNVPMKEPYRTMLISGAKRIQELSATIDIMKQAPVG